MTTEPQKRPCATRRGVLLGACLTGLGGALAGCSTAAVPYDANEAGVVQRSSPGASAMATAATPMPASPTPTGTVLGTAGEIPVGGGKIFTAAKVVVTQPVRGQYLGFSAVCTHVGCILSEVVNGTIDCPCHGSQFTITNGDVITGPAPRPLPEKQVKIVNGQVVLV